MKQQLGMLMQFAVLVALPAIIFWQLDYGIPLVVMPAALIVGILVFWAGTRLRES